MNFLFLMLLLGQVVVDPYLFSAVGPTYLINQNFEGTGYDNSETWTETATGTVDEDYTGDVIAGSQSLRIVVSTQTGETRKDITAISDIFVYFRFKRVSGTTLRLITFRDTTNTRGLVNLNSSGTLTLNHGSASASTVGTIAASDSVHIWVRYTQGTGADGFMEVGFSTDGTKPTSGNNYASTSVGTSTTTVNRIALGTTSNQTAEGIFDRVLADDVSIGNNP